MASGGWDVRRLVLVGILAGLAQVAAGVAMYLGGVYFAPWSMLISVVVLLLCIVIGVGWYTAHRLAGAATYRQALLIGAVISLSTGIVYAIYNFLSIDFFYPHFLDDFARAMAERRPAVEQTPEALRALRATLSAPAIAVPNLVRLTVFGTVLSAVCGIFLRTSRSGR